MYYLFACCSYLLSSIRHPLFWRLSQPFLHIGVDVGVGSGVLMGLESHVCWEEPVILIMTMLIIIFMIITTTTTIIIINIIISVSIIIRVMRLYDKLRLITCQLMNFFRR